VLAGGDQQQFTGLYTIYIEGKCKSSPNDVWFISRVVNFGLMRPSSYFFMRPKHILRWRFTYIFIFLKSYTKKSKYSNFGRNGPDKNNGHFATCVSVRMFSRTNQAFPTFVILIIRLNEASFHLNL
jgi:hypothetical protein